MMEDEPYEESSRASSAKKLLNTWTETVTKCLPCFGSPSSGIPAVDLNLEDLTDEQISRQEELIQNIRAKELELIQAEQRLTAENLSAQKLSEKLRETENTLQDLRSRSGVNPTAKEEQQLQQAEQALSRLSRKLQTLEKYHSSLLSQNNNTSSNQNSEAESIQRELTATLQLNQSLQTQIDQLSTSLSQISSSADLDARIQELEAKITQLKEEASFASSVGSKITSVNISSGPVRRGRLRGTLRGGMMPRNPPPEPPTESSETQTPTPPPRAPFRRPTTPAPTPPAEDSSENKPTPPPVAPLRRGPSIAERAKMFQ